MPSYSATASTDRKNNRRRYERDVINKTNLRTARQNHAARVLAAWFLEKSRQPLQNDHDRG